ncbi:hypothetical protein T10_7480 [Trichinella papuae]|uniref:Uncharacterized protein n=1 Tax=Trichinella papuae TaxID=268474 RepID=A0A0V1M041_9BILA|nr:hypothetical protein T10_7480 [Trichinella papuae]
MNRSNRLLRLCMITCQRRALCLDPNKIVHNLITFHSQFPPVSY